MLEIAIASTEVVVSLFIGLTFIETLQLRVTGGSIRNSCNIFKTSKVLFCNSGGFLGVCGVWPAVYVMRHMRRRGGSTFNVSRILELKLGLNSRILLMLPFCQTSVSMLIEL